MFLLIEVNVYTVISEKKQGFRRTCKLSILQTSCGLSKKGLSIYTSTNHLEMCVSALDSRLDKCGRSLVSQGTYREGQKFIEIGKILIE